jgi:hypothetical protein
MSVLVRWSAQPQSAIRFSLVAVSNAINATLYDMLNFKFNRDIAPVASIAHGPSVMEVHPSVPAAIEGGFDIV